ncbi:MAG: hypothetical protein H7175_16770 [Burkholderiales bacterium]|nr:hypothetical protein [Anaerolineae bacterium]
MKTQRNPVWLLFLVALAGCRSGEGPFPSQRLQLGDERASYSFSDESDAAAWDTFVLSDQRAMFRINEEALEGGILDNLGYIWSINAERYDDVAGQSTMWQTEGTIGSGFGLMCRADGSGNGYYFLISGQGRVSIRKATPEQGVLLPLVEWQDSAVVRRGNEPNTVLAVCVGDYLAMFVNDQFVAEARDEEFSSGQVAVTLAAAGDDAAWVRFDDISTRDVLLLGPR